MSKYVVMLNQKVSRSIVALIVTVVISGCASIGVPTRMLPAGSQVQVTQELNAVSGSRVTMQYGRVMPREEISWQDPHCQFYLYRTSEEMRDPVVVQPGTFTVKRTYQRQAYDGVQLASTEFAGDPTRYPTTIIELSSDQQPEVRDLRCAIWGTTAIEGYLTLDRMQAALGDLVKLIFETK